MFGIGPMELVVILVMALLVLGPKRMPELARTLGRGLSEFRRASSELRQSLALDDLQNELRDGIAGKNPKPGQKTDRPAQAGDDLDPGKLGKAGGAAAAAPTTGDETKEAVKPNQASTHSGELPLDEDPHAHHDEAADANESAPPVSTRADSPLGNVPVGSSAPASPASSDSPAADKPTPRAESQQDAAGQTAGKVPETDRG